MKRSLFAVAALLAGVAVAAPPAGPELAKEVLGESVFTLTENSRVSFGQGSAFVEQTLVPGNYICHPATFGVAGSPAIPRKICSLTNVPGAATPVYTKAADEFWRFTLTQASIVRFGKNGVWVEATLPAGTHQCVASAFGGRDPVVGVAKVCEATPVAKTPVVETKPTEPVVTPPVTTAPVNSDVSDPAAYRAAIATLGTDAWITYKHGAPSTAALPSTTHPGPRPSQSMALLSGQISPPHVFSDGVAGGRGCGKGEGSWCGEYQIGTLVGWPGDYSSSIINVAYTPDATPPAGFREGKYWGVASLQTLNIGHGTVSWKPEPSWTTWIGPTMTNADNDENTVRLAGARGGSPIGTIELDAKPVAAARGFGRGGWVNNVLTVFANGAITTSGSNTSHNFAKFKLPDTFKPTAIAITNSGEFALVTGWKPTTEYALSSGASAAGAIVDANDILVAIAQAGVVVAGTVQDRGDVAAGSAAASIAVVGSVRDASDLVQASAQAGIAAAAGVVDAPDAVQAASVAGVAAAAVIVDGADTVQASALLLVAVAGLVVDRPDAAQGSAALTISVTAAAADAPDTVQAASSMPVAAAAAVGDAPDVVSGAAAVAITVVGSVADAADVLTAAAAPGASAAAVIFDAADVAQGVAAVGVQVVAGVRDAADRVVASAQAVVVASSAIVDSPDSITGQAFVGAVPIAVVGSAIDVSDTLQAAAKVAIVAAGVAHDTPDLVQAQAEVARPAIETTGSIVDAPDAVAGQAVASIAAMFARTDDSDILIGNAATAVRAVATVFDGDDLAAGAVTSVQLPVIDVVGTVYDVSDWLVAFARTGDIAIDPTDWIRYAIPTERRHYAVPAEDRSFTLAPEARTWTLRKP